MPKSLNAALFAATVLAFSPLAAQAQGQQPAMPEGEAKLLVEGLCVTCHRTNLITASLGYTREGWNELIGTMIDMSANPDMRDKLTTYLAAHFPPNTRRAPTLVSGPVQITWKEWVNPQLGQRSRDPMEAPDGSIWWAGQFGNVIGRLDPKTGEMKEYQLPAQRLPSHGRTRCQGERLVHGQQERHGRLYRFQDRADQGLQDARPEREGPAHAGVRS